MEVAVRTHDLSRQFAAGHGIQQVSLEVPRGSIYGFLGPNGSGKTTTIRLLLRLLRPQRGHIELLGQPLAECPAVLTKVGALVESPSLYPHLSGRQNLEVTRRLLGQSTSIIGQVLQWSQLTEAADRRVSEYSLGMRQRLGIALALLGSPELLILDEPSNGLDPAGMAELRRMLHEFAYQRGITVLISSHLLGEIEQIATHVGVLHAGRLRFQGTIDELRGSQAGRLRLRCTSTTQACAWMCANGHPEVTVTQGWLTTHADSADVPRLIHRLFEAGIEVVDMALEPANLETLFFNLTDTEHSLGSKASQEAA